TGDVAEPGGGIHLPCGGYHWPWGCVARQRQYIGDDRHPRADDGGVFADRGIDASRAEPAGEIRWRESPTRRSRRRWPVRTPAGGRSCAAIGFRCCWPRCLPCISSCVLGATASPSRG